MTKLFRFHIHILLLVIVIYSTYAFASANTNKVMVAGEGAGAISGWVVSNIRYQQAADPSFLAAVEFDLDKPAGNVRVSLDSASAMYSDCDNIFDFHWVCYMRSNTKIASINELGVVAVDME